jgi:hypothetical protein
MKTQAESHFVPTKVHFSAEQMSRIRQSWREHWGFLANWEDEMSNEEFLAEASKLGFIQSPTDEAR